MIYFVLKTQNLCVSTDISDLNVVNKYIMKKQQLYVVEVLELEKIIRGDAKIISCIAYVISY